MVLQDKNPHPRLLICTGTIYGTVEDCIKVDTLPSIWDLEGNFEYLVEGLFPDKGVTMLSGDSGCGKSTLALSLAYHVARGDRFLGRETKQKPVLIVDKENGEYVYHARIIRLGLERTPEIRVWGPWCPDPTGPLDPGIVEFAKETKGLIIFDSLIAFHTGSEQDASETRKYTEKFQDLTRLGATVFVIHHTGKGENTKNYRGSSDIKANIDFGYVMYAKSQLKDIRLHPFKTREGTTDDIYLRYTETGKFVEERDTKLDSIIACVAANNGSNGSTIVAALEGQVPGYRVRKLLDLAVAKGQLRTEKGLTNNSVLYYTV